MNRSAVKLRYQDEEVAFSYDELRLNRPVPRLIHELERRAFLKALGVVRREQPLGAVLDAPCGTGRVTEWLLDAGAEVLGGDISEPMLAIARTNLGRYGGRVTLRRLDLEALDLPPGSFELVSCIRLFNHCGRAERERILHELGRVSRRFVLINISYLSPLFAAKGSLKRMFGLKMPREPWSWAELVQAADAAGMRVRARFHELKYLSEVAMLLLEKR
jgi:SAM-dependent methyltransferase